MDPYITFFNKYSHLATIPIVAAALYIGWRKGFLGLEGTARRSLIGVGVLGLVGLVVYLSSLPPSPGAHGSFKWPILETDYRCDSDSDYDLAKPVWG